MIRTPSPGYSIILRLEILSKPGMLGKVTSAIGRTGGDIGAVDIVGFKKGITIREIIISVADILMGQKVVEEIKRIKGVTVLHVTDRTFMVHQGGKIEIKNKIPLNTREDLSMAYTPGVARICMAIHENRDRVYDLTIKKNTIAIVTDGTAVLGLGDIGPEAAMPGIACSMAIVTSSGAEPPNHGRICLAMMGCTRNSRNAPKKMAAA